MIGINKEEGWTPRGRIKLVDEKLVYALADLPERPGLYRLDFGPTIVYFGEAGDLRRRIGDYLEYYEGTGIESEFRINQALRKFQGADISIISNDDFGTRFQRCTEESRLIKHAKQNKWTLLNGGIIPERIAFHASEIMRLSKRLRTETADGAIT